MPRRLVAVGLGVTLAAWTILAAILPVAAQQGSTIAISTRSTQISDVLDAGRRLETQRRWGEALTHYEDAIRLYPADPGLQQRFDVARMHYDLGRRYADRSFCQSLGELSLGRSLDVYGQVLLKIQAHYVDAPNWEILFQHGMAGFAAALTEPTFIERNISAAQRDRIDSFLREMDVIFAQRRIASRSDARDAVAAAAQLAQERLGCPATAAVFEFLCGATNALDPYSTYLTPDQLNEVYSQIDGNFVGLGVELKAIDGDLAIVRTIVGSPAQLGGVRAGDRILAVDGKQTNAMSTDQAANLLQGVEGSVCELVLAAPGQQPRTLRIRRQRVDVPSIDQAEIVDRTAGIAYMRLACFQKTTCRDLDAALWKLYRDGMKSLVIDLRGNPGGLLVTSVEVADRFLERGVVVSTRGRTVQEDFTYTAKAEGTWRVPLVLIIDQNSASAAEIFAGAIRDHHRGTIVGVRSFGKGSVQGIFPLDASLAGVRLTTAKFYSPSGKPYAHIGVEPDVTVQTTARPIDGQVAAATAGDAVYAAALQAARNNAKPR